MYISNSAFNRHLENQGERYIFFVISVKYFKIIA